jgi:hypothetical protein
MSGVATAIAGAAVVGAVAQSKAASKANRTAKNSAAAELDFAKQQYQDWQDIFGPIQDNLADYYNNLTPDYIAATGLQNVETERAAALERVNQSLAQRGLLGSGLEAAAITDIELETAERKSQVRSDAPMQAAQQKLGFLSLGYGQNPAGTLQNTLSNRAQQDRGYAVSQQQAAGQAVGSAITTAGTALSGYLANRPATPAPAPNTSGVTY